jgi:hypothetical protein
MTWAAKDPFDTSLFDHCPRIYYIKAVTQVRDDSEIVANEQYRSPVRVTDLAQEPKNLGLDSDVEGCGGLISNK